MMELAPNSYLWSTKVNFPSMLCLEMNSVPPFGPIRSLQFGVLVTWRRPMPTRQQCVLEFSSESLSIWTPVVRNDT